jgi:hypothetical protein
MNGLGRRRFIVRAVLALVCLALWMGLGKGWLGRLPGDLQHSSRKFSFYLPLVSGILASLLLTVLLWLFREQAWPISAFREQLTVLCRRISKSHP